MNKSLIIAGTACLTPIFVFLFVVAGTYLFENAKKNDLFPFIIVLAYIGLALIAIGEGAR